MAVKKGKFKSKGADILKNQRHPGSMKDFLEDRPLPGKSNQNQSGIDNELCKSSDAGLIENSNPQLQKSINFQTRNDAFDQINISTNARKEETERFHLQIRKDLADKLYEAVFKRKRDQKNKGNKRKEATQRAIVEEALEKYFAVHEP
ncbi:hypothetical protein D1BOALGB6SA_4612 [Olavius sp. associated proteobacterium Delta 1]|nr:hypothetical protein D1BOALGB6SA_4612 [Olavius sp. associated proteobacterium Delta 1]